MGQIQSWHQIDLVLGSRTMGRIQARHRWILGSRTMGRIQAHHRWILGSRTMGRIQARHRWILASGFETGPLPLVPYQSSWLGASFLFVWRLLFDVLAEPSHMAAAGDDEPRRGDLDLVPVEAPRVALDRSWKTDDNVRKLRSISFNLFRKHVSDKEAQCKNIISFNLFKYAFNKICFNMQRKRASRAARRDQKYQACNLNEEAGP